MHHDSSEAIFSHIYYVLLWFIRIDTTRFMNTHMHQFDKSSRAKILQIGVKTLSAASINRWRWFKSMLQTGWQNRAGKNLSRIDCDVVAKLRIWFKDGTVDAIIHGSPNIEPSPTSTAHIITLFSLPVNILKSYTSCQHGAISFSIRDSIIKTNEWSSWSHILWHGYSVVCLINGPKPESRRREVIPPRTARSRW